MVSEWAIGMGYKGVLRYESTFSSSSISLARNILPASTNADMKHRMHPTSYIFRNKTSCGEGCSQTRPGSGGPGEAERPTRYFLGLGSPNNAQLGSLASFAVSLLK